MKKLLLGSAAIAGLVLASAPAQAQMELTIGGHSKNYVGWLDQDAAAGAEERNFDMIRETELHFNGESTLDNGLTFGFQIETEMDAGDNGNTVEESYIYFSGTWGRVNLGSEDGAAYLLQVAAPSADSNIDGIRQYIQPINYGITTFAGLPGMAGTAQAGATNADGLDYDQDLTGVAEKITYLSPNWNGFQLGASYTPDIGDTNSASGVVGFNADDAAGILGEAYDVAIRYEGVFSNFGYAIGAGYTGVNVEQDTAAQDDQDAWNIGLDVDSGPFGIGVVYTETDLGTATASDVETLVVGADYTSGPFKFGASFLNTDDDSAGTAGAEIERLTGGVVYTAGPGLSFRGSLSHVDHDITNGNDLDGTSIMGGVQINF